MTRPTLILKSSSHLIIRTCVSTLRRTKPSLLSIFTFNQQHGDTRTWPHNNRNYCLDERQRYNNIQQPWIMKHSLKNFPTSTVIRCSSTDSLTTETKEEVDVVDPKQLGEDYYKQYLLVWNELNQLKEEQERMKSEKMFEAWKRTQQSTPQEEGDVESTTTTIQSRSNKNAGGVAVVRTLAREVSKNRDMDPISKLEKRAQHLLQIAGIKYKHPKALVELANIELQRVGEVASVSFNNNKQSDDLVITNTWIRDNVQPCLQYYEMAGDAGVSEGYYNLAHIYWDGIPGIIVSDRHIAMNYMQKAIYLGDIDAMYFVGLHRLGHRTEYRIDQLQKAVQWLEQAAQHHHGGALQCLAVLYMRGCSELNIPPCSNEEFQRRLSLAIEHDENGNAYWLRALSYCEGSHGYPMDIALWFNDLVKAAELGHGNACLNAGVALFQGFPGKVEQDQERAFQYYQRAGELGTIEGWRNVVDCYATGQGVKKNIEMAKYIGDTMIRPYDDSMENSESVEEDEEVFEENPGNVVNTDAISDESKTKANGQQ